MQIANIEPFRVMQLLERAKELEAQGKHIIHMEIGEPDFTTPNTIIQKAHEILDSGDLFYTPSTGLPALQQALSSWYADEYNVSIAPERILITPGTSGAFSMLYAVLLERDQSVLLPDPGYPCQRNFIRLAGGKPINIPVDGSSRYHLSAELLAKYWQKQTRAAVLISPGNPSGTLINSMDFASLIEACSSRGGYLISDEIYHGLSYDKPARCALEFPSAHNTTIVVNGFSKRWAMTGWRIGWVIVPEDLIDACKRVMQNIFIAAPTLSQHAAITALQTDSAVQKMRQAYDQRRRYLLQALPKLGFKIVVEPQGAFYIYADVSALTQNSRQFCWSALEEAGVAITPGEDFGTYKAQTHVRFSYATSLTELQIGITRLEKWLEER
ncbi:MAG: aminotransferase class I/II-fold pyridoxal phosphate-dependent enzyme [Mariprofundales bacterium]